MKNFLLYFLERALSESEASFISESFVSPASVADKEKNKLLSRYYEKYANVQYEDVEDAFGDAVKEMLEKKPKTEPAVKKTLARSMERILSGINKKKRGVGKNLSCVKAIKSSLPDKEGKKPISELMKRAEKILTNKEMKILRMCSEGKSVRVIGSEMEISYPTAWRLLNSAIDKIRMSHGMRPRHMDRR